MDDFLKEVDRLRMRAMVNSQKRYFIIVLTAGGEESTKVHERLKNEESENIKFFIATVGQQLVGIRWGQHRVNRLYYTDGGWERLTELLKVDHRRTVQWLQYSLAGFDKECRMIGASK